MGMKVILITGVDGTGKTTLLREIEHMGRKVLFVPDYDLTLGDHGFVKDAMITKG